MNLIAVLFGSICHTHYSQALKQIETTDIPLAEPHQVAEFQGNCGDKNIGVSRKAGLYWGEGTRI